MTDSFIEDLVQIVPEKHHYIEPKYDDISAFVTKTDEKLTIDSFERFRDEPRRPRGTTTVWDVPSLLKLLHTSDATIFADDTAKRITAILNYDEGWRDYRLILQLKHSPEWTMWADNNGKLMRQSVFAEFLEDAAISVTDPSAAELIQIAHTFHAKKKVDFESGVRLDSGDVSFTYREETAANAGRKGDIKIPEEFQLRLPVYAGGGLVEPVARLRYRVEDSGLLLGYRIPRIEEYARAAFTALIDEVTTALDEASQPMVYGPAPEPIREI